ncbi:ankyrin repeat-containing protein At5g02620-like [Juglans microcarpa x Juglans regia]|uniref:ankyrin repeat-containing protein At5g02620-like n=1 Tax=Juglans microcarpa x Juglans regia TaxID=2249226 RepID=UPI001B7E9CF2|nr:ankyrin repeat-containing protein At5g02620-like [Juglans microcarpa x Juglans regia]
MYIIQLTLRIYGNGVLQLLWQANANDEIPLHIAARYGHTAVIKFLLERANDHISCQDLESGFRSAREMLGMMNKEKDTALHEAVRYNHLEAAKLLMVEDPEFSYFANVAGETPLYMAAERILQSLVSEIINTCKSPAYNGHLGRTALHAAACWEEPEVIKLIQKIGGISKEADQKGWTPLHLAAHYNKNESTKLLLEYYRDVAYMKDTEGRTALHIAAHRGHHMVMEKIISHCPDCCELVDNRGWNALHFAAEGPVLDDFEGYQHIKLIIGAILDNRSLGNLLNQKDADGNTPLHHFLRRSSYWLDTNDHRHTNGIDNLFFDPRVDQMAFNNENLHAWEIALTAADVSTRKEEKENRKKAEEKKREDAKKRMKDIVEKREEEYDQLMKEDIIKAAYSHLVVAALITTVTFAAGITMPGGFVGGGEKSQPAGSAILRTSAAFKAFVITDVLAMVLSTSAIFIHMFLAFTPPRSYLSDARISFHRLAFLILLSSMIPMVLAFITGTYAVLAHSFDVAIPACIIGLSLFPMVIFIFKRFLTIADHQALKGRRHDSLSLE